jgi:hypothetical protein
MVNRPRSFLAYCAILLVITANAFASPKEADPRGLILSVFNDASVPAEILAQGEARAAHILAQTGIQVEWLNCAAGGSHVPDQFEQPSRCSRIGHPSHLSVRIVLAYAHLAEPNAHLPLGEGELLGYVIAHEVGHLLLGTDSHNHEGIMQGRWEDPQLREAGKGNLQFTPSQARLMRQHLTGEEKKKESRRSTGNQVR